MNGKTADLVRTHVVTGQPEQVRAALARAQADGRLLAVRGITQLADRQVQVTAELREHRPRTLGSLRWPSARAWLVAVAAALGAAAVIGVVWVVAAAVMAVVAVINAVAAWLAAYWPALAAAAVVLFVAAGAAGGVKRRTGLHCRGCRWH